MITSPYTSHNKRESGMALFIAIIFSSVVLLIGLTMASFGYKQAILSSSAVSSQKAYYAADSAMECALYADQQEALFTTNTAGIIKCAGANDSVTVSSIPKYRKYTFSIRNISPDVCADVVVYKETVTPYTTYIYSTGYYNVGQSNCSVNTHTTVRGLSISYGI